MPPKQRKIAIMGFRSVGKDIPLSMAHNKEILNYVITVYLSLFDQNALFL